MKFPASVRLPARLRAMNTPAVASPRQLDKFALRSVAPSGLLAGKYRELLVEIQKEKAKTKSTAIAVLFVLCLEIKMTT